MNSAKIRQIIKEELNRVLKEESGVVKLRKSPETEDLPQANIVSGAFGRAIKWAKDPNSETFLAWLLENRQDIDDLSQTQDLGYHLYSQFRSIKKLFEKLPPDWEKTTGIREKRKMDNLNDVLAITAKGRLIRRMGRTSPEIEDFDKRAAQALIRSGYVP